MDQFRTSSIGMLLIGGLLAGILAYTISSRRAVRELTPPEMLFERAKGLGGTDAARLGREFVNEKLVPEMKPVLIDLLKDAESYVGHYFDRAEKAIKSM